MRRDDYEFSDWLGERLVLAFCVLAILAFALGWIA